MIKRVEKYRLSDGSLYTGSFDDSWDRPIGSGYCSYPDGHEAMGTFIGIPNGVSYINYGSMMQMGFFTQGLLQGWGMTMGNGDYCFGIFHRGNLIKDCTVLMEDLHEHVTETTRVLKAKGINVRWGHHFLANDEVFFGIMVKGYKKIGIRFFPSGDVFLGLSPYSLDVTGTFVHLKDSLIESGVFENGQLINESPHALLHSNNWIELLHTKEIVLNSKDERALEISKLTSTTVAKYL